MTTRIWPTMAQAIAHSSHTARAPLAFDAASHLLSRFTFGPNATSRAHVARIGPDAWYAEQVALGNRYRGYAGNPQVAAAGPLLTQSPAQVRAYMKGLGNEYGWNVMSQLTEVTLGLQAWSTAQLYETLVDLFSNHLNVANHSDSVWITRHAYDRDVIRAHALGSFTDMLLASARHPAMLTYLNLAQSTKQAVNENYGRELLELHTVGLHYSESDVQNAAHLLTGRTIDANYNYLYNPAIHPTGSVRVLGFTHANSTAAGGEAAGDEFLRYLASHPDTAATLARKLCVHYVSDAPSADLIAAVASAYLRGGTQILPMVHTILCSSEFWQSRGLKVRKPTENLMATIRILGTTPSAPVGTALQTLHWMTAAMGNVPLDWATPDGYPDVAAAWRSSGSLLYQWNLHLGLAGQWWNGFAKQDLTKLYARPPKTSGDAINLLTQRLTGMTFSAADRATLQTFLGEPASTPMAKSTLRWLLYPLLALILDGPHHALR
jgi:hypothetical protein